MADIQKLNVNNTTYDISTTWEKVTGKPSTFPPDSHTHSQYLTSALRPAKLFTRESMFPPGYFIITINNNNSKWVLSFDVKIVVSDGSYTIRFSEDNSTKSESWYRPSASMIDGEDSVKVKFGYSRTNKWVAIVSTDSYAGVSITNVANGYAPIDTYALDKLFTIEFWEDWGVLEGDDSGLEYLGTVQETITIYPPSKEGHTHTKSQITDFPSSLPASDVYAWAKASTKPTYTYSEVGAAPASHTHSYLPLSGGTMTGSITMSQPSSNRRVGIIGTYDPNRAAAIWSMGSSYQIAADGLSFGSLYGAAYAYYGSGYTFGAGKSGDHSFVWCQGGSPTAALGNNVWTSGGFIKNGSSNSYVLLGGGGHKAESSLSVNYANSAGSAPASDVYAWAKASTKPTYTYSEVGAAAASHTHSYLPLSGGTLSTSTSQISRGGSSTSWYLGRSNAMLKISSYSGYNAITSMKTTNGDWSMGVYSGDYMYFTYITDSNFNAGNNSATAQIYFTPSGYIYSSGFYQSSDERLKTFYEPIKPDLEKLRKLRKNYFKFNDKDKLEIGVSAQEIQNIYPEIVSTDDNGYLSVAYDKLSVIALAAIDELDDKILQLANKISTLENILNKLMGEKGVN